MKPKYPLRGRNETGDVVIDVTEIVAPDSAFTEGSGVLQIATSTGDVTGPASATDNAFARFNGATGKTIQNGAAGADDSGNIYTAATLAPGYALTSDAVVDAQMTVASAGIQRFTASAAGNNVLLPVVATLPQRGTSYLFINDTAGNITVASSGGNAIATIPAGQRAQFTSIAASGTTAAGWATTLYGSGLIAQTITNGVTTSAPSQDAVYDALAATVSRESASFSFNTGASQNLLTAVPVGKRRIILSITIRGAGDDLSSVDGGLVPTWGGGHDLPGSPTITVTTITGITDTKAATVHFSGLFETSITPVWPGEAGETLTATYGGTLLPGIDAMIDVVYYDVAV